MQAIVAASFQNLLLSLAQLSLGCLFPFAAQRLRAKGISLAARGTIGKAAAMVAGALLGMALPLGPFGLIPVAAAAVMAGLELPCVMPLIVSGFLFNSIEPLTQPVFVWSGSMIRIAAALILGVLSGVAMLVIKKKPESFIRGAVCSRLLAGPGSKEGYFRLLGGYVEAAGLFAAAGAILNAAMAGGAAYWLQNLFFSSDAGLSTITAISRLDVFNPFFTSALQVLGRLVDFMMLASAAFLFHARSVALLYAYYLLAALLLSIGLFF